MNDGLGPERLCLAQTLLGAKMLSKILIRHNFHNLALKYINMGVQINRNASGNSEIYLFFHFEQIRRFKI